MLALCRGCILTVFTLSSSLCKREAYVLALWYIYALGLLGEGYGGRHPVGLRLIRK